VFVWFSIFSPVPRVQAKMKNPIQSQRCSSPMRHKKAGQKRQSEKGLPLDPNSSRLGRFFTSASFSTRFSLFPFPSSLSLLPFPFFPFAFPSVYFLSPLIRMPSKKKPVSPRILVLLIICIPIFFTSPFQFIHLQSLIVLQFLLLLHTSSINKTVPCYPNQ